jgi:membrane protein required for colicin V production
MSLIDIVLLLPLAYGSWRGFKSGFILGVFSLLAIVVGIYVAVHFSDMVSDFFIKNVGGYSSAPAFAFTFTFLVVGAAVYFGGVTLEGLLKASNLSVLNRLVGLVFGFLTSFFILSVILLNYQKLYKKVYKIYQNLYFLTKNSLQNTYFAFFLLIELIDYGNCYSRCR